MSGTVDVVEREHGSLGRLMLATLAGLAIIALIFGVLFGLLRLGDNAVEYKVDDYFAAFNSVDFSHVFPEASEVNGELERTASSARQALGDYMGKTIRGITIESDRSGLLTSALYDAEFTNGMATVEFRFTGAGETIRVSDISYRSELLPSEGRGRR